MSIIVAGKPALYMSYCKDHTTYARNCCELEYNSIIIRKPKFQILVHTTGFLMLGNYQAMSIFEHYTH